jgi:hypothetical protein
MCLPLKPFKIEREWEHAGLKCAVVQNHEGGIRCGYVRVPPTHPLHGKSYDDTDVNVHGGLTFAQKEPCTHEDGTGWWFGFDCAHYGDAMHDPNPDWPNLSAEATTELMAMLRIHQEVAASMQEKYPYYTGREAEHYWLQAEVERETERLAEQLADKGRMEILGR